MNWNEFWLSKWSEGRINFHQENVESFLVHYFPKKNSQTVLVPLCGKSKDMIYFADNGYQVIAVELSELACDAFFAENNRNFTKTTRGPFTIYESESIRIYCGDFFELTSAELNGASVIYDRAALIALPQAMREKYCQHLFTLFHDKPLSIFLITLDYDQTLRNGPPFSVDKAEVKRLYETHFAIEELVTHEGIREIDVCEHVFLLTKNPVIQK